MNVFFAQIRLLIIPDRGGECGSLPPLLVAMTVVTGLVVPCSWQKIPKGGPMTVAGDSPDVIDGGPEPDEARTD